MTQRGPCSACPPGHVGSGCRALQEESTLVLERERVTLAGLHLGINSLAELGAHPLCIRVGVILDHTP
jgi:hypothetical protein